MKLKVLLADDSPNTLNLGRRILVDAGFDVTTADGGDEAVERLARFKPDLVVLDAYMPGFNGFELCRAMKSVRRTARIPIVLTAGKLEPLFSGDSTDADDGKISQFVQKRLFTRFRKLGSAARADAILRKPFEATDLLYVVQQLTHLGALPAGTAASKPQAHPGKPTVQRLPSGWVIVLREPQVPPELVATSPKPALASEHNVSVSSALEPLFPETSPELPASLIEDLPLSDIQELFPETAEIDFSIAEPAVFPEREAEIDPPLVAEERAPALAPPQEPQGLEQVICSDLDLLDATAPDSGGEEIPEPEPTSFFYEQNWVPIQEPESGFDWQPQIPEEPEDGSAVEHATYELDDESDLEWACVDSLETGFDWTPAYSVIVGPLTESNPMGTDSLIGPSPTIPEYSDSAAPDLNCETPELTVHAITNDGFAPRSEEVFPIVDGPRESVEDHRALPVDVSAIERPILPCTELYSEMDEHGRPISEFPPHIESLREAIAEIFEPEAEVEFAPFAPESFRRDYAPFEETILGVNREGDGGLCDDLSQRTENPPNRIRRAKVREEWLRFVTVPPAGGHAERIGATVPGRSGFADPEIPATREQWAQRQTERPLSAASSHGFDERSVLSSSDRRRNESSDTSSVPFDIDDQMSRELDLLALSLTPEPVEEDLSDNAQVTTSGTEAPPVPSGPMADIDLERFLTQETPEEVPQPSYRPSEALVHTDASSEEAEQVPLEIDLAKYLALRPISQFEIPPSPNLLAPAALFSEAPLGATAEQMVDEALQRIRPGLIEEARRMLSQNSDATGTTE